MTKRTYQAELVTEADGRFSISIPALSGCLAEGDTREEAIKNLQETFIDWYAACKAQGYRIDDDFPLIEIVKVEVTVDLPAPPPPRTVPGWVLPPPQATTPVYPALADNGIAVTSDDERSATNG
jgi:predicted RNase H-like HicB family nuclease